MAASSYAMSPRLSDPHMSTIVRGHLIVWLMLYSMVHGRLTGEIGGEKAVEFYVLTGLGSSVTEWEPNEPRRFLKFSGVAVGLRHL